LKRIGTKSLKEKKRQDAFAKVGCVNKRREDSERERERPRERGVGIPEFQKKQRVRENLLSFQGALVHLKKTEKE
jgi:hypothetical protein